MNIFLRERVYQKREKKIESHPESIHQRKEDKRAQGLCTPFRRESSRKSGRNKCIFIIYDGSQFGDEIETIPDATLSFFGPIFGGGLVGG